MAETSFHIHDTNYVHKLFSKLFSFVEMVVKRVRNVFCSCFMNEVRRSCAPHSVQVLIVCLFCTKTRKAITSRPDESELNVCETTTGQMMAAKKKKKTALRNGLLLTLVRQFKRQYVQKKKKSYKNITY